MRNARLVTSLLLATATVALLADAAAAQQSSATRVIVLRFEGRGASQARNAVISEVSSNFEIVDEEQAVVTAEQMGVDVSTPEGMAQVVRELGVTLVITGSIAGRRRRGVTTLVVVDPEGTELSRRLGPEPGRASDRVEIGRLAVEAVNEATAALEQQRQAAQADASSPPDGPVVYDDEVDEPDAAPREGWRHPMIQALAGLRLRTVGTYVNDEAIRAQRYFEADIYPEIEIVARFRPWTDDADEGLRGILFGIEGAFSVGLSYFTMADIQRSMTSFRFRVEVGYGFTIADIFEFQAKLGFGIEGVQLEMPDIFPSTLFSFLRPALVGRVRAYEDFFAIEGGFAGRIGLDGGELASGFGPGMFFGGVDLFVGISGIASGFTWAARLGYQFQSISLDGPGGSFGNGSGGTDEAIEIGLLVGYSY